MEDKNRNSDLQSILSIPEEHEREQKLVAFCNNNPEDTLALEHLAKVQFELRHFESAEQTLDKLFQLKEPSPQALQFYAQILIEYREDYTKAREYYEKALEANPGDTNLMKDTAYHLSHKLQKHEEAIQLYEKAAKNDPKDHTIYRSLANLLYKYLGDYDKAAGYLKKALEIKPDDAVYHYFLAFIYSDKLRDFQQATFHYLKAIELNPNLSEARGRLRQLDVIRDKTFISHIDIREIVHLNDMTIEISEDRAKHLFLTGKNGSGKSSLLKACRDYLERILEIPAETLFSEKGLQEFQSPTDYSLKFRVKDNLLDLRFKYETGNFVVAYFPARRNLQLPAEDNLRNVQLPEVNKLGESVSDQLIAFLWNLKAQSLLALEQGDTEKKEKLDGLLQNFEQKMKRIDTRIKSLNFTSGNGYDIEIIPEEPYKPFSFSTLADGYASVFNIMAELILRMQNKVSDAFDLEGIVMIDEPEAHLHIDMQKTVIPVLTEFFPNIQFIVATHSPFIVNSLPNAVVYDLANDIRLEDASGYAYDGLVETYFEADKYSGYIKEQLKRYRELMNKNDFNEQEKKEYKNIEEYFENIPNYVSPELIAEYQRLKLLKLSQENDKYPKET